MYLGTALDTTTGSVVPAASTDAQATFRAGEIVAQNTAAAASASKLPRLLMAGVGLYLVFILLKGKK